MLSRIYQVRSAFARFRTRPRFHRDLRLKRSSAGKDGAQNPHLPSGEKGVIGILGVLTFSAAIFVIGAGMVTGSIISYKISSDRLKSTQNIYTAESGAEDALLQIRRNPSYGGNPVTLTTTFDSQNYVDTTVETGTANSCTSAKIVTASGYTGDRVRRIKLNNCPQPSTRVAFNYGLQAGDGGVTMGNTAIVNGSVYSNGNVLGSNNAQVTGDVWVANVPAPDAGPLYDPASPADYPFGTSSVPTKIDVAQSFLADTSQGAKLGRVSLKIRKYGSPSNATVRIVTDNAGKPSATQIASGTINAASVTTTAGFVDVSLTSTTNMTNGARYWIVIDTSSSANNYWGWSHQDGYADGSASYSTAWSSTTGGTWTAAGTDFAFKIYVAGPVTKVDNVDIGAQVHANTVTNSSVGGNAYYQTISNTRVTGSSFPGSADPSPKDLPISDANVQEFHDEASVGPTYEGNYTIPAGTTANLGPLIINGDFSIGIGATFNLRGTIWVKGNINFNNNTATLDPGYGDNSGTIVADGTINLSNNFTASGATSNSYILLLSTSTDQLGAVNVSNNAAGILFASTKGALHVSNNGSANAVSAYKIVLDNQAVINYSTGLSDIPFSAGPGGGYAAKGWQEVIL